MTRPISVANSRGRLGITFFAPLRLCGRLPSATLLTLNRSRKGAKAQRKKQNTFKLRPHSRLFTLLCVGALTLMNLPFQAETQALVADTIIVNAIVHTMDPA